jgi:ACS family hexuronate transporter-like MFS transporter
MTPEEKPPPQRWWILALLFAAMTINILDRQVLSLVAPVLRDELGLSNTQYGSIVFSFLLGMTLGQIPVGMMMDRWGARAGFSLAVAWWSVANMLHAGARSAAHFSILRFLLGLGECGTYSAGVKVIGQYFPPSERALAAGLFNSGSLAGAIIAPPLIVFLTLNYGWPAAFLLPSLSGILWLVPWLKLYRPAGGRGAGGGSLGKQSDRPGRACGTSLGGLARRAPVWGVILMRAFGGPVTHFYWYWLPEYLRRERGMSLEMIGLLAWLPFFSGGLGNIGGGWFSSRLIARGWTVNRARKTAFRIAVALSLAAALAPWAPDAGTALALICLASLGINALAANLMGLLTDLFPERVLARVSGMTGVGDGAVSMTMMQLTGVVVDRFSYLPVFVAAGAFPLAALASLELLVGEVRRLDLGSLPD